MDITYLKELIEQAQTGKFSAAAKRLHLSASTLTRHVQALEKELGLTLIERTTREVRLSEEGEVFLPHAMNIVSEYDAALIAMQAFRDSREKKVRIGVVHNPDLYNIIEYLLEFQLEHPDIPIQIIEGSLSELQDEFLREKIRIYTMAYADWERLPDNFIPAGRSWLVAVLPKDHPYERYDRIPLCALGKTPLIVPEEKNTVYQFLCQVFEQEGIDPDIFYQGNTTGVAGLLKQSQSILIQDMERARGQVAEGLSLRKLDPEIGYTFGLEYADCLNSNERTFVRSVERLIAGR